MIYRKILFSVILTVLVMDMYGQKSGLQCFWAKPDSLHYSLGTLFIDKESISTFPQHLFSYDSISNEIIFSEISVDSLLVCYRAFSIQNGQNFYNRDIEEYFEDISSYQKDQEAKRFESQIPTQEQSLFKTDNVNKMGAISRSLSFGNTQNVFVNSTLNLQLEGDITDDLKIQAVISDQNVPFQPDGNTQQIRDFDNVFIRLYNERVDFIAGDIVLKNQESNFLRYFKNVQGAQVSVISKVDSLNKTSNTTKGAISVAKGQFTSILIDAIEGVLGPYRLKGPNNERFVIVLANSEKVFLDGKLLQRGFDRDYVIDYNLSEVTFNPNVLITKFSRIRVDFEYADQNYTRSILALSHEHKFNKLSIKSELYREKDNPNQPLAFGLSDSDKLTLRALGPNVKLGSISGADSVGFNIDRVLYEKVDTLVSGVSYSIFKYSNDPRHAFFNVTFTEKGTNQGNYIFRQSNLNGRLFEWVAPINGELQGNFEPEILVATPNQKQVWSNSINYQINSHHTLFSDIAVSNQANNLYATTGEGSGIAQKSGYRITELPLWDSDYILNGEISYEYNSNDFKAIDRFRYIEFDRDWSYLPSDSTPISNENILIGTLNLRNKKNDFIDYKISNRVKSEVFTGAQHSLKGYKKYGRVGVSSDLFAMQSEQEFTGSKWTRWNNGLNYETAYIVPGYNYQIDRNSIFFLDNDSIFSTAMNFEEHQLYIKTNDSLNTKIRLNYAIREDKLPVEGALIPQNRSQTWTLEGKNRIGKSQQFQYNFTYRWLDNLLDDSPDDITTMGRLDWMGTFFDRLVTSDMTYSISNSRELRREFVFIAVNNGLGTHTWRDDNADGIQDLSEFYLAVNPDERNYIKIFTPTDDYVLGYNNLLNFRFSTETPRSWRKDAGLKRILGSFSTVTSFLKDTKTTSDNLAERYNPFVSSIDDAAIISTRENVRTTLFVNRGSPKFGTEVAYFSQSSKQLLTNGIENRQQQGWNVNGRYNLKKEVTFQFKWDRGSRSSSSDVLLNRNFLIDYVTYNPQITWQPSTQLRLVSQYSYRRKTNIFDESSFENSTVNEISGELRWSKAIERNVIINLRLLEIGFEGEERSAVGYELLEALRPGTNFTWSAQWQQRLVNGLQLSLSYEGRKSEAQQPVHIGRMQVTALF